MAGDSWYLLHNTTITFCAGNLMFYKTFIVTRGSMAIGWRRQAARGAITCDFFLYLVISEESSSLLENLNLTMTRELQGWKET